MSRLSKKIVSWILGCGVAFGGVSDPRTKPPSVERKLIGYLEKQFEGRGRIEVDHVFYKGTVPVEAEVSTVDPKPSLGWVTFELVWQEDGLLRKAFGTASVKQYVPVAVTKTVVKNNDPFTADNVTFQEREVSPFRVSGVYVDQKDLFKLKARSYLTPGSVISHNHTQIPFMVNSGETLELIRETPTVKVSMRVKALENGRENQWIRVENPISRKVVQARVIHSGEVSQIGRAHV